MNNSPIDFWNVTTEGDCEGRSTTHLGCYQGHFADIAFALRKKCYYTLNFERGKDFKVEQDDGSAATVNVRINGLSRDNSWYQKHTPPGVNLLPGQYYESVVLSRQANLDKLRAHALSKLTPDEIKALGLNY
jgi:hypothetical protein